MKTHVKILHLEDDLLDAELLNATLEAAGLNCEIVRVDTEAAFRKILERNFDLIIGDYTLPDFDGKRALAIAKDRHPEIPFIFLSGTIGEEAAIESLHGGATDYVLKHKLARLLPAVQRALQEAEEHKARRLAEEQLQKSEERYRRLFEESRDTIFIASFDGTLIGINPSGLKMFGYASTGELLGANIGRDLYQNMDRWNELQSRLHSRGYVEDIEVELKRKDGTKLIVLETTSLSEDKDMTGSFHGTWRDVTKHKELEAQFLRSQRLSSLGMLASGIAHDLNNILTPIMLAAELLRMRHPDAEDQQLFSTVEASAKRGGSLVKQVLTFARGVEGERITLQPKHLIIETERMCRETFPRALNIVTDIAKDLRMVFADSTQLHQVVMNLCVNARDAMQGKGTLSLSARNVVLDEAYPRIHPEAKAGAYVVIEVSDTGTGISADVIDRIFEPFFTTKELEKGTGLGLSTVLAIVKGHGGFVNVHSEPGKGAHFAVHLPAAIAGERRRAEEPARLPAGKGELILVVYDEAAIRDIMRATLEAYHYRTIVALNGAEAVASYVKHQNEVAAVVCDSNLPLTDGLALVRALETINPAVKIIAGSGFQKNEAAIETTTTGSVKAFLSKPFTAEQLLKALREVLERSYAAKSSRH